MMLIKSFGWSLAEIDRTDSDSLFALLRHNSGNGASKPRVLYADEVDWDG
ncbi:MAG: hypothetical protein KBA03_00730 [Anaerolineaceae bacterium]|nr:hypothetical protein [Anaerolineaceae bacterium]